MADRILPFPDHITVWRRGAALAFSMLREIEATSLNETAYEDEFRDRRPQLNIVAAYLARLKEETDPRCELAFAAILTDHLASEMHAGEPNLDFCEQKYVRTPIATALPTEGRSHV